MKIINKLKEEQVIVLAVVVAIIVTTIIFTLDHQSQQQNVLNYQDLYKTMKVGEERQYTFKTTDEDMVNHILIAAKETNKEVVDITISTPSRSPGMQIDVVLKQK